MSEAKQALLILLYNKYGVNFTASIIIVFNYKLTIYLTIILWFATGKCI
jgi:hypothetical protein